MPQSVIVIEPKSQCGVFVDCGSERASILYSSLSGTIILSSRHMCTATVNCEHLSVVVAGPCVDHQPYSTVSLRCRISQRRFEFIINHRSRSIGYCCLLSCRQIECLSIRKPVSQSVSQWASAVRSSLTFISSSNAHFVPAKPLRVNVKRKRLKVKVSYSFQHTHTHTLFYASTLLCGSDQHKQFGWLLVVILFFPEKFFYLLFFKIFLFCLAVFCEHRRLTSSIHLSNHTIMENQWWLEQKRTRE